MSARMVESSASRRSLACLASSAVSRQAPAVASARRRTIDWRLSQFDRA